ncbi:uncharacterized protein GGS22DRAFT_15264 [Annulohypoxylon maeteangense]|uniref:uncharacterized protein n=1 Tax=Annulohypoxylon maeteangense TaxID=1927788 RepID=UPI002008B20A|nr:uncharacterized protein GGS22DRAFT_15264 [Annulohypoxylon maeteangense]KAI0890568.1 hypothetical protein GGS22DRAFT_15264 [Annulohypoxylon maeteangense]
MPQSPSNDDTKSQKPNGDSAGASRPKSTQARVAEILQDLRAGESQADAIEAKLDQIERHLDDMMADIESNGRIEVPGPKEQKPESKK